MEEVASWGEVGLSLGLLLLFAHRQTSLTFGSQFDLCSERSSSSDARWLLIPPTLFLNFEHCQLALNFFFFNRFLFFCSISPILSFGIRAVLRCFVWRFLRGEAPMIFCMQWGIVEDGRRWLVSWFDWSRLKRLIVHCPALYHTRGVLIPHLNSCFTRRRRAHLYADRFIF